MQLTVTALLILVACCISAHPIPGTGHVRGRSMEPALHDGDHYTLADTTGMQRGDLVRVRIGGFRAVKRLAAVEGDTLDSGDWIRPGRVWLTADNPGDDSRKWGQVARSRIDGIVVPDSTKLTKLTKRTENAR